MKAKIGTVLKGLGESTDLQKVLEGAGISAAAAMRMIEGAQGKRELDARRALSRLHVELLAHRYGALAMAKLCGLLDEKEKLDVRLKAAMAVLKAMGTEQGTEEQRNKGTEGEEQGEGDGEILRVVAELMEEKRREKFEG